MQKSNVPKAAMDEESKGNQAQSEKDGNEDGGALFEGMEEDGDAPSQSEMKDSLNRSEVSADGRRDGRKADRSKERCRAEGRDGERREVAERRSHMGAVKRVVVGTEKADMKASRSMRAATRFIDPH